MKRSTLAVIIITLSIVSAGDAKANGLTDADKQAFGYGFVSAREDSPLLLPAYPAIRIRAARVFQTSYRRLYNLNELTEQQAGAALRLGRMQIGLAAATFGRSGYYYQQAVGANLNADIGGLTAGVSLMYTCLSFNDTYAGRSRLGVNSGLGYVWNRLGAFVAARSLNRPKYSGGISRLPREAEAALSYASGDGLESQVRVLFREHSRPTACLSQRFRLRERILLDWTMVFKPVRFGAGLSIGYRRVSLGYRISHHTVLGETHLILFTVH